MYVFKETDVISEWISTFIEDRLYFGPYPNQLMLEKLLELGIDLFVDLTTPGEIEHTYKVDADKYLSYPIEDNGCPSDIIDYCVFINKIYKSVCNGKRIYINCRGGHSRSSMVVVSLNCMRNHDVNISIDMVTEAHNDRKILRDKWKRKKHPLHYNQFSFLIKIHRNLFVNINGCEFYSWLSIDEKLKKVLQEEKGNVHYILYNYFSEKFFKNKELNFRLQLTYLRKFIIVECDDIDLCRNYVDILRCIRETILSA
jgi:hypothetical protein